MSSTGHATQSRAETFATLPPYTSPRLGPSDARENSMPLRPSGLLGINREVGIEPVDSRWRDASPDNPIHLENSGQAALPVIASMTQVSPELRPHAELDTGGLKPLGSRRNTQVQVAAPSSSSIGSSSLYSRSPFTPIMTSRSSMISPDLPPLEDPQRQRQDSLLVLDEITPEDTMQDLRGVTMWVIPPSPTGTRY